MDRPKRAATKVTDFHRYHLSGNLNEELQGRVDSRVTQFEMAQSAEELKKQLEEEKENSRRLQEDVELMKLQNELEAERMAQKQWHTAKEQLWEAREHAEQEHLKAMAQIKERAEGAKEGTSVKVLEWLNSQVAGLGLPATPIGEQEEKARQQREQDIQELVKQQEEISKKLSLLRGGSGEPNQTPSTSPREPQDMLLQQLRTALTSKQDEDPNKALLRALITTQNKSSGEGGTTTLKPHIISGLASEGSNNMAEWLAGLNKQEEGESELSKLLNMGEGDQKGGKVKSGILDRATTNI